MQNVPSFTLDNLHSLIFASGVVIAVAIVMQFRIIVRCSTAVRTRRIVLISYLLGQLNFLHVLQGLGIFGEQSVYALTIWELAGIFVVGQIAAFVCVNWSLPDKGRLLNGLALGQLFVVLMAVSVVTMLVAHPVTPEYVGWTQLGINCAIISVIAGLAHAYLTLRNKLIYSILGLVITLIATQYYYFIVSWNIVFDFTNVTPGEQEGLSASRIQVFLMMISIISISLSLAIGDNPRQHWRRYGISVVLVGLLSISVFKSTETAIAESNRYYKLARLVEALYAQRAELFVEAHEHNERLHSKGMMQSIPADIFEKMQDYFETSTNVSELINDEAMATDVRDFYLGLSDARSFGETYSLEEGTEQFYSYLKSSFGLQSSIVNFDQGEEFLYRNRLSELSRRIIQHANSKSEDQIFVLDMSLFGGIYIVCFLAFGVFVPAHRSTVRALDELEAEKKRVYKLAICAEHTNKGVLLTNRNGRGTWCNAAFEAQTGFSQNDVLGRLVFRQMFDAETDMGLVRKARKTIAEGNPLDVRVLGKRKDGEKVWLDVSITPVLSDGEVVECVHVVEDVTEKKKMTETLQAMLEENQRLALIARHAADGMATFDRNGELFWINPALETMLGYSLQELLALPDMMDTMGGTHPPELRDEISQRIRRRQAFTCEFSLHHRSGKLLETEAVHTPIFNDAGQFDGYILVYRDITTRKKLQLELIESRDDLARRVEERTQTITNQALELEKALASEREHNRMQTEFVSMASHEFRTPLTIIDGVARRIEKRAAKSTPEDICERAATIRATVKRMTMLVERTLDATRLSSGRIKLTPESFDPKNLLHEVCNRHQEMSPGHSIQCDIDGLPDKLFGDAKLLDNVFTNIVSNAVKYSGERKQVFVHGWCESDYAVMSVKDTGIGIPKEELPKIFQRFFRASTSTGIPGTGIGLNLVKSLVEMHYGDVSLESEEGEWTKLTIRLPLESPLQQSTSETEPPEADGLMSSEENVV